jgi:hypothetical protein
VRRHLDERVANVDILVAFLIGAVVLAVLMHLHFKHASDAWIALVSPQVFAIAGALIGIAVGMVWFPDTRDRIYLENGMLHAVLGAVVGALVGAGIKEVFARLTRARILIVVFSLSLLAGSIGAPIGWVYAIVASPYPDHPGQLTTRAGILWGLILGCVVGLVLGLLEACFGKRRLKNATTAP